MIKWARIRRRKIKRITSVLWVSIYAATNNLFSSGKCSVCVSICTLSRAKSPGYVRTVPCPNIIGNVGWDANGLFNYATGAFRGVAKTGSIVVSGTSSGAVPYKYADFSASRSSSLYSGTKLQPPAFQTLMIIKVWSADGWTESPA